MKILTIYPPKTPLAERKKYSRQKKPLILLNGGCRLKRKLYA